jgi:hypothetical protein
MRMAKFVLSARAGEEELANYSPEQLQVLMQRYRAWLVDVRAKGRPRRRLSLLTSEPAL